MFAKVLSELLQHFGVQKGGLEAGDCLDFGTRAAKETDAILGLDFGTSNTSLAVWDGDRSTVLPIDPIAGGVEVCDVMRFAGNHGWIYWSAGPTPSLSLSFTGAASSAALARLTVTELN